MSEAPITKHGSSRSFNKLFCWALLAIIAVAIAIPVYFVGTIVVEAQSTIHRADAGFKKAKKTINLEQLRAWALDAIERWPETNGPNVMPQSEIPGYIQNLYATPPEIALVNSNGVSIFWGGGFFHWVLSIGPTNYVFNGGSDYQTIEWTNGIYYSHESNRKIQ